MNAAPAYYILERGDPGSSDERFVATELTRGPWSNQHQHAGPPCALLARAIEGVAGSAEVPLQLARLTVEILRPIPLAALTIATEIERPGRKVRVVAASLVCQEQTVARARALLIRHKELALPAVFGAKPRFDPPEAGEPFEFPFFQSSVGYHKSVDIRMARGEFGHGPCAAWFRMRQPLVAGEEPSPWQRVVVAADSGNGISIVCDPKDWMFINPDLSITLHRAPEGEWIALDAETLLGATGVGLAESALFDLRGRIGRSIQSLFVDRQSPAPST